MPRLATCLITTMLLLAACGGEDPAETLDEDAPRSAEELEKWWPEPPEGENAAEVYEKAFAVVSDEEEAYSLLKEAAAMPHYRYPVGWAAWKKGAATRGSLSMTPPNMLPHLPDHWNRSLSRESKVSRRMPDDCHFFSLS